MIKTKVAFVENFKSMQRAPIGWEKVGPLKSHFCFDHVNRLLACYHVNRN